MLLIDDIAKGSIYYVNNWVNIESVNVSLLSYTSMSVNRNVITT
jgi:hypothetical protein